MSTEDWNEVKRLAADFQRAQLSSAAQRLSERNCIEIVNKLIEDKSLEVIHTNDGKEYLTHAQLMREIRDELIVHCGRINLVELQQIINVDFSHIEAKTNDIVKSDKNLNLILGKLIDSEYLDLIADEINDKLQESGQVSIAELTKHYDLPGDFIIEVIEQRLGTIIKGQMDQYDRDIIFTESYVARQTAIIRGVFSAITRPTPVISLLNQYKFHEKLFYNVIEKLVEQGRLKGSVVGGKQDKSSYVPDIYAKTQNNWVDSFYQQNGYLEYDTLARLGIQDGKSYLKRRYKSQDVLYLHTVCVGRSIQDQMDASIDEALNTNTWVDISPLLPSPFTDTDANQLLNKIMKDKPNARVFCDSIVASQSFLTKCKSPFENLMKKKAEKDAKNAPAMLKEEKAVASGSGKKDKRDERRKRATGGAGSTHSGVGGNAREVKIKKAKKGRGGRFVDAEDEEDMDDFTQGSRDRPQELKFMSQEEIEDVLSENLTDCSDNFISEIASELVRPLTKSYQEVARSIFMQTTGTSDSVDRRKTHSELQDRINGLWTNIKLFEKGIKIVSEDLQGQLYRYILKTLCSDISNLLFEALANDNMLRVEDSSTLTPELRAKLLNKFPANIQSKMTKLHNSLTEKNLDDFNSHFDDACSLCDVMLKKSDKKKDRQLIFNHRQALAEQIRNEEEPAMLLHLCSVMLFQTYTNCMIHVPGRCVPQLIAFLADEIPSEHHEQLLKFQGLVQKRLGTDRAEKLDDCSEKSDVEINSDTEVVAEMSSFVTVIREIALSKKHVPNKED
ncbi:E3 UFM1-protein ligase 1-like isoform X2 [Saccoglossus kowalevskii]